MLRQWLQVIALIASCCAVSQADWTIKTVTTTKYGKSETTEYFSGGLRRVDQHSNTKGSVSPYIQVLDLSRFRQTLWRTDLHQYVVQRIRHGRANAAPPAGPVIVINRVTIDTGERKYFFGRSARHLITQETTSNSGALNSTKIDGWYIDTPSLPRQKRGTAVAILTAGGPPRIKVNQTGPSPSGLAVWERRWHRPPGPNGSSEAGEITTEVTDLTEAPLPDDVFRAPAGFQRVISFPGQTVLPWSDRVRLEWERVQDWVSDILS